jgi:superfamily II DNA or RNA helicase
MSFTYIGTSEHCEGDSKIGKSSNLYSRENSLECSYSRFAFIFKILIICSCDGQALEIEEYLHKKNWNNSTAGGEGGVEWFDKQFTKGEIKQQLLQGGYDNEVIDDPLLINNKIEPLKQKYEKKKQEYIRKMVHSSRLEKSPVKPYEIQEKEIIQINIDYFNKYDIGKNILPPGTGKTLCSLFTALSMGFKRICIGVPSIALVQQWIDQIKLVFMDMPILGIATNSKYNSEFTTDKNIIDTFIKQVNCCVVVVYDSCHKLVGETFDFKVGDECHHLTGEYDPNKDIKRYTQFHKIQSKKTLFMTGTSKTIVNMTTNKQISSMDNEELFGKVIVEKSILWAIKNNLITDYRPIVLDNKEDDIIDISRKYAIDITNIELFLTAVMTLKAFLWYENLSHVFVYANSIQNAEIINDYITEILEKNVFDIDINDVYNNALCSNGNPNINKDDPTSEISKFTKQKYGIICCVYMFGEGYDLPMLNGVVFAENMGSEIRIVQSTTRCFRKDKTNLNKLAYVLFPYLDTDDWNDDSSSFKKLRDIVNHIGNKDESIGSKIVVHDINKKPLSLLQLIMKRWKKICKEDYGSYHTDFIDDSDEEYLSSKIKLRLRKSGVLRSRIDQLQDEFMFMKERNKHLNLSSKSEYNSSKNDEKYIDDPERHFEIYWTNWYDFLGYDTSEFIQTKEQWIIECKKNNIKSLEDYKRLCENDVKFPINPSEFYQHYTNFNNELNLNTQRRR